MMKGVASVLELSRVYTVPGCLLKGSRVWGRVQSRVFFLRPPCATDAFMVHGKQMCKARRRCRQASGVAWVLLKILLQTQKVYS